MLKKMPHHTYVLMGFFLASDMGNDSGHSTEGKTSKLTTRQANKTGQKVCMLE